MTATNEPITAEHLARELIDRCIKAEVRVAIMDKRENVLLDAVRGAARAKNPERVQVILRAALDTWEAML